MKILSLIDVGSNSTKCLVAKISPSTAPQILFKCSYISALGEGLKSDSTQFKLSQKALKRNLNAFNQIKSSLIKNNLPLPSLVFATEATRRAQNKIALENQVQKVFGNKAKLKILKTSEEAFYSSLGASQSFSKVPDNYLTLDIGGASSELSLFSYKEKKLNNFVSIPFGGLNTFISLNRPKSPLNPLKIYTLYENLERLLENYLPKAKSILSTNNSLPLIIIGGTMYKLASLCPHQSLSPTLLKIKTQEIEEFLVRICSLTLKQRAQLYPDYNIARLKLMPFSTLCLLLILSQCKKNNEVYFSSCGLRHGFLSLKTQELTT